jgi:urease gamma subunit
VQGNPNARNTDPDTSHEAAERINKQHVKIVAAFFASHDRPEGWTQGEVSDSGELILERDQIWRRISDALRLGWLEVVYADGLALTRVWSGSGRPQRALRVAERWRFP